ncbi:arginine-specific demethylase JMJ22 isoform X1 [Nymphaea colorata]|nr:arginine-specific demethylase JMJ22 isoform X1 [Nymphaea colorata]
MAKRENLQNSNNKPRKKKRTKHKKVPENGFCLQDSLASWNHGVQPLGNLLLAQSSFNSRDIGLGNLCVLTDESILDILGLLGAKDLCMLSLVSRAFYVFSNHDPLWRNLVLEEFKGRFSFTASWKHTYVSTVSSSCSLAQLGRGLQVRSFYSDYLFQSWLCANIELKQEWLEVDNIERRNDLSIEDFILQFEKPNKPVLLCGCLSNWAALKKWDRDYLMEKAKDVDFSVGPVDMSLQSYYKYADSVNEERPLYLFDPRFVEKVPSLSEDYEVPVYFREDLFSLLGDERPDFRWLIIGPARSGSSFHIDPNSTSAWNAVVRGSKKWILFPPDIVPPGVHPSDDGVEVACPVSILEWFMNFYEQTKQWKRRPIECICKAGEVMFVPNGWWHLVINLEDSIAITQNYVSRRNLLNVLDFLKSPNAKDLVSGTRDRVNLYHKFRDAYEASFPGSIKELMLEDEAKKAKKTSFWDSVMDAKVGSFKFGF